MHEEANAFIPKSVEVRDVGKIFFFFFDRLR